MDSPEEFSIVVPIRDDAQACRHVLETLALEQTRTTLPLRVLFLVNDTPPGTAAAHALSPDPIEQTIADPRFASLAPRLLRAERNYPTVEENIRHTLGGHLDAVGDRFLIVGGSDHVRLDTLAEALAYLGRHRLDLLLIGVVNCEVYQGQPLRQLYTTPRHLNAKNRLADVPCHGPDIFAHAMSDYGPVDYLAFIGCQIYTKPFFRALCQVQTELPDPLYSIPLATLELCTRHACNIGFFPDIVVERIDRLQFGPDSDRHSPDWWVLRSRTDRGLSSHILFSAFSNTVALSPAAFHTVVNAQRVAIARGKPIYHFTNCLHTFVYEISAHVGAAVEQRPLRYSAAEQQDIVRFAERLDQADIGLPADRAASLGAWLRHFGRIGDYSDRPFLDQLLAGTTPALGMLDARPGMERWVANLI